MPQSFDHDDRPSLIPKGFYIVATPIGNMRDITLRALDVLQAADLILCEDTRVTGKLLAAHGITRPKMYSYHDHSDSGQRDQVLAALGSGAVVALCSDAGTPLLSDPGFKLVQAVVDADHPVVPIPGASALLAGLVGAGLPTDQFSFLGFLPTKAGARRARLEAAADLPGTLVFYEAPRRLPDVVRDMADCFGPDRPVVIARELTKLYESWYRGTLGDLDVSTIPDKGEAVILLGPAAKGEALSQNDLDQMILDRLQDGKVKEIAADLAQETGLKKQDIYNRAVQLKDQNG